MKSPVTRMSLVAVLVVACTAAPLWSLIGIGPFAWHVLQPAAWQGGLEAAALLAVLYAGLRYGRGFMRWAVIAGAALLYARHHGVDGAILASYLYMEGMFALGTRLAAAAGGLRARDPAQRVVAGLAGLVGWSLVLWISSLLGLGSMQALAWMSAVLLGALLLFHRGPWLAGMLFSSVRRGAALHPAVTALIATLALVLFAKASVSSDFDSNWYGLAADRALVASGSVFHSEGLVAPVHYYPKLIELLQVPLAALGSIPAIVGLSVACWLATLAVAALILRELRVGRVLRPYIIALLATLPAFANISMTAKGDSLAALLLATGLLAVMRLYSRGGAAWFCVAASAALLASQARLSNIPYTLAVGGLALLAGLHWLRHRRTLRPPDVRAGTLLLVATLVLAGLITARTWWLAGVPLVAPNAALQLFSQWGWPLRSPVGHLPTSDMLVYLPPLETLFTYLFDPRRYPLLQILWTGNAWLCLSLAALLLGWNRPVAWRRSLPVLVVGLLFFPMLLGNRYIAASGADGNYFITPLLCLFLFSGFLLQQSLWKWRAFPGVGRSLRALIFCVAVALALLCLVTGLWGPGTRAFDTRLDRTVMDTATRRAAAWRDIGLENIAGRLALEPARTRVVGDAGGEAFWLPVRYEPIDIIALTRPGLVDTPAHTLQFLDQTSVQYLIVRGESEAPAQARQLIVRNAARSLAAQGRATRVMVEGPYELWKLHPAH